MWRLLLRGLRRRCPSCGSGGVFESWFRLAERCPRCALRLEREPGAFLGAYFLNICLVQLALAVWAGVGFWLTHPDPPMPVLLAGAAAIAVVVPLLGYPFAKTVWLAIHQAMGEPEPDEQADAAAHRFERGDAGPL